MRHMIRCSIKQKGVVLAELAITLPLLLFLVLGLAEFGRAFYQYTTLTKAVRDGARYLSSQALGTTGNVSLTPEEEAATKNLVVYGSEVGTGTPVLDGLATSDVTVSADAAADHVTVTATYVYSPMFGGTIPTFGLTGGDVGAALTLTATNTMRFL
jgi:Flp pilus assembly protein TadG